LNNEDDKKPVEDEKRRIVISDELFSAETLINKKRVKPSIKTNIPNLVVHKNTTNKPD